MMSAVVSSVDRNVINQCSRTSGKGITFVSARHVRFIYRLTCQWP
jgi:hypothetical protein